MGRGGGVKVSKTLVEGVINVSTKKTEKGMSRDVKKQGTPPGSQGRETRQRVNRIR